MPHPVLAVPRARRVAAACSAGVAALVVVVASGCGDAGRGEEGRSAAQAARAGAVDGTPRNAGGAATEAERMTATAADPGGAGREEDAAEDEGGARHAATAAADGRDGARTGSASAPANAGDAPVETASPGADGTAPASGPGDQTAATTGAGVPPVRGDTADASAPNATALDDAALDDAALDDTAPDDAAPDDAVLDDAAPDGDVSPEGAAAVRDDDALEARAREAVEAALGGRRIVRIGEDRPAHPRPSPDEPSRARADDEARAPGTAGQPPELVAARTALELEPTDADALETLVGHQRERGELDRALFWVDRFLEHGGDPQVGLPLAEALDPLREAQRALVDATSARLLEDAETFARREWMLCAAARIDAAAALGDPAARQARDDLLRRRDAVRRLARYGAPLPDALATDPRISPERVARLDAKAAARGKPHEVSQRHVEVITPIGYTIAWQAARVLEETWRVLEEEYDPNGLPRRIDVQLAPTRGDFDQMRHESDLDVERWATGFYDAEARCIHALDVRELGAPRQRVFGLLAHELAHLFLDHGTSGHALPVWLDEGLAMQYEGARLLGDGEVVVDAPSAERLHEAALALADGRVRRIDDLLLLRRPEEDAYPWLYALVAFLRHGEDDEGTLLWADRFVRLLDDYRSNVIVDPVRHFEEVVVGREPRAGVLGVRGFESLWHEWIRWRDASLRGDGVALHRLLTMARSHLDNDRPERAWTTLRDALAIAPDSREALSMWIELHEDDDEDAAMLGALNLASASTPGDAAMRFGPCVAIDRRLGERLAEDDRALRDELDQLVSSYVERGFPRAAVRLLERFVAAWPLDREWRARAGRIQRDHALPTRVRHRLEAVRTLDGLHGDRGLYGPEGLELLVQTSDRAEPASLRGLERLEPPYRAEARIELLGERDPRAQVGLTFAAPEALLEGAWGVLATGDGHLVFARQKHLEWETERIGTWRKEPVRLAVEVTASDYEPFVDGRSLGRHPLRGRAADGWLGLYARRADARLSDLVVLRESSRDPHGNWATLGRR